MYVCMYIYIYTYIYIYIVVFQTLFALRVSYLCSTLLGGLFDFRFGERLFRWLVPVANAITHVVVRFLMASVIQPMFC